ncbi:MAG: hypothetical protein WCD42_04335 [Rhizomicrobium sp.]
MSTPLSSRNWLGKLSAGVIAGFALALVGSGLFYHLVPGGGAGKMQLAMWLMAPVWAGVISFCFLFRNGVRAWVWLGGSAVLLAAILLIL